MSLGCSLVGQRQRTGTGILKERRVSFEHDLIVSRDFRGLRRGADDDGDVRCDSGLFAAADLAIAMVRHGSVPHWGP